LAARDPGNKGTSELRICKLVRKLRKREDGGGFIKIGFGPTGQKRKGKGGGERLGRERRRKKGKSTSETIPLRGG